MKDFTERTLLLEARDAEYRVAHQALRGPDRCLEKIVGGVAEIDHRHEVVLDVFGLSAAAKLHDLEPLPFGVPSHDPELTDRGMHLRRWRRDRGITIGGFADRSMFTVVEVSLIERGRARVNWPDFLKLLEALDALEEILPEGA